MLNPTVTPNLVRVCEIAHLKSRVQMMRREFWMRQSSAVKAERATTPEGNTVFEMGVAQSRKLQWTRVECMVFGQLAAILLLNTYVISTTDPDA